MTLSIGLYSHAFACAGYLALALLVVRGRLDGNRLVIAVAAVATAVWAGAIAVSLAAGRYDAEVAHQLETVRSAAWIGALIYLLRGGFGLTQRRGSSLTAAIAFGFVVGLQLVLEALFDVLPGVPLAQQAAPATLFVASRLLVAITGLVLVHNLYSGSREQLQLAPRLLCVGIGALLAYDLNLYTLQFLLGTQSPQLITLRGAVDALVVPLIALAMRGSQFSRLRLSRRMAFQTVSVMAIGLYLIAMSLLAWALRLTGGSWGELLQVLFVAVALISGALIALSPRIRAELRERIVRNFYPYRYDYRVEWLRFLNTLDGDGGLDQEPIRDRFVMAIARVIDSPGGVLLEPAEDGGFETGARWNWRGEAPRLPADSGLASALAQDGRILTGERLLSFQGQSSWLTNEVAAAVPLLHREQLAGIVMLRRPMTARLLDWEDEELLVTLGRQGASYLAEAAIMARLEESRQFDDFNRRFAFIMHDVKNVVSQLGLLARNAERHAGNPAFQADMVTTLQGSVTKMNDLLALLGKRTAPQPVQGRADMARIATAVVAAKRRAHSALSLEGAERPVEVTGDAARLEEALGHLVQNALDASQPDVPVIVRLIRDGDRVRLQVQDHGDGMTPAFIRDELFKPFRSTKHGGFGIGAYEAREIVRQHGGRLEVASAPGQGSMFTITLPVFRQVSEKAVA